MVLSRFVERLRHVRHFRYDVDGNDPIRLWPQKCLDSLALAGLEPSLRHGLFGRLVAPLQCNDGS